MRPERHLQYLHSPYRVSQLLTGTVPLAATPFDYSAIPGSTQFKPFLPHSTSVNDRFIWRGVVIAVEMRVLAARLASHNKGGLPHHPRLPSWPARSVSWVAWSIPPLPAFRPSSETTSTKLQPPNNKL